MTDSEILVRCNFPDQCSVRRNFYISKISSRDILEIQNLDFTSRDLSGIFTNLGWVHKYPNCSLNMEPSKCRLWQNLNIAMHNCLFARQKKEQGSLHLASTLFKAFASKNLQPLKGPWFTIYLYTVL